MAEWWPSSAKLGKAPACPAHRWTWQEDAILGTLPDEAAGELLGRTKLAVSVRRHKLGVPSFHRASASGVEGPG